mmetsp:Transcript_31864/g.106369  ORF Transcript_31864/g.106369 Transcript_31864/m.106369 type:complete len:243 (-) Transcript_31864:460-1188(-)
MVARVPSSSLRPRLASTARRRSWKPSRPGRGSALKTARLTESSAANSGSSAGSLSAILLAVEEIASGPCSPPPLPPPPSAPRRAGRSEEPIACTLRTRSSDARPAAWPGGSGTRGERAGSGGVESTTPIVRAVAGGGAMARVSVRPDRSTVAFSGRLRLTAVRIDPSDELSGSALSAIRRWLSATSLSPGRSPAASAAPPVTTRETVTGGLGGTPSETAEPKRKDHASRRFAITPAPTTAAC